MTEPTEVATPQEPSGEPTEAPKPTETVDFWKQKAREQEKRAKDNADAAKRLAEIEESQKTEAEKAADRIAKAEAEVAGVPAKVSEALRAHLVDLHGIEADDAELFLTATEPELLLKQAKRLLERSDGQKKKGPHVPKQGNDTTSPKPDDMREFTRDLFARAQAE